MIQNPILDITTLSSCKSTLIKRGLEINATMPLIVIAALVASWPSSPHCVSELAAPADLGPGVVIKGNSLGRFRWRRTTEKQRPSGGIPV